MDVSRLRALLGLILVALAGSASAQASVDAIAAIHAATPVGATLSAAESEGKIVVDGSAPSLEVVSQVMHSLEDLSARGTIEAPSLDSVATTSEGTHAFRITTRGAASPRRMGGE